MADENPNGPDWTDATHYKVVLRCEGRQLTTYFSMGYAHTNEPSAADVLDCLASDSSAMGESFEDWCRDLGESPDSRKAERTYNICRKQAEGLKRLLGKERFEALVYETERL